MAKILIVDDSPSDIRFMTDALKVTQHDCVTLTDSTGVEAVVEAERPQLALLDVVMPERNGYETLRALKRLPAAEGLKVVFVSSKGAETDVKWGLRQGAVDYLIKPYTPEQLLSLIARHV
jgi:twitching motility two-component system response regulator PilH